MTSANFRVSTDILRRLGEELITSFDQGIVELVKNSYDADALRCVVELQGTDKPGGTVIVSDDGDGMSINDIQDGWFVLGRSRKTPHERTARRRLPAGSKGLGRLGALRLGDEVILVTRPRQERNVEYMVRIRWPEFDRHEIIEDVTINISSKKTTEPHGTRIEIRGLKNEISEAEVTRLARELILLSDPFGDPTGFSPELVAPEFEQIETLVRRQYFEDYEFRLEAHLDRQGKATAKAYDRSGNVRWVSKKNDFDAHYRAPEADFELWVFLVAGTSFEGRTATLGEIRRWLRQLGGVHLYHRRLRVRPYGDPGHDWLDMNLARSRDPELRPSTNTSVGRMTVLDEDEQLLQKTDRMGFVENTAFIELKRFGVAALVWMHGERLAVREEKKENEKAGVNERVISAESNLSQVINSLAGATPARRRQSSTRTNPSQVVGIGSNSGRTSAVPDFGERRHYRIGICTRNRRSCYESDRLSQSSGKESETRPILRVRTHDRKPNRSRTPFVRVARQVRYFTARSTQEEQEAHDRTRCQQNRR